MRQHRWLLIVGILLFLFSSQSYVASSAPVVVVTGFEPFGNYTMNPSELIAETLNGTMVGNASIVGMVLPVDFNSSVEMTIQAVELYHPVLVLSVGLNARAHAIQVEKIGVNLKRYPKGDGTWSFPRRILTTGPFLRITPIHTQEIVHNIRDANIPVKQSFFAGTYVCNALFYQMLGYIATQNSTAKVGFIHVPLFDSQDPQGMSLETMVEATKITIQTNLE